jgi:glyoxylase I family protein
MIKNLNHVSFTVSNLNDSIKFYKDVLNFKLFNKSKRNKKFSEKVTGIKNAKLNIAYMELNNFYLELIEYEDGKGTKIDTSVNNIGSAHVCFNINNFNNYLSKLLKSKLELVGEPTIIPDGPNKGKQVVYVQDIDNNKLEFISLERI